MEVSPMISSWYHSTSSVSIPPQQVDIPGRHSIVTVLGLDHWDHCLWLPPKLHVTSPFWTLPQARIAHLGCAPLVASPDPEPWLQGGPWWRQSRCLIGSLSLWHSRLTTQDLLALADPTWCINHPTTSLLESFKCWNPPNPNPKVAVLRGDTCGGVRSSTAASPYQEEKA